MAAALRARRRRPDLDISIIEQSLRLATANCSIPAYLDGRIESIASLENLTAAAAAEQHHLNILARHRALEIDARNHSLKVRNLETDQVLDLPYHRLILATGAKPIKPAWPNVGAKGVFTLRSLDDALALRSYLDARKPMQFAVIGTGTIAQVCAAALRSFGVEITLIGPSGGLMEDLEKSISERIAEVLAANGIDVYFTDNVIGFKVSLDNEITAVETGGRTLSCQGALIAMGVEPNAELARTADLAPGFQAAIRIDPHLMTSRQGIYACGDCAQTTFRLTHRPFYWPLATTASRQGRQAGENASGGQGEDPGTLAARIWTCFQLQIGRVGLSSMQALAQGIKSRLTDIKAPSKPKFYGGAVLDLVLISDAKDDRLVGAQLAGYEGVHARLNMLCAAIAAKLTLKDLENMDLGYTPEVSSLWDPVQIAGRRGRKRGGN